MKANAMPRAYVNDELLDLHPDPQMPPGSEGTVFRTLPNQQLSSNHPMTPTKHSRISCE